MPLSDEDKARFDAAEKAAEAELLQLIQKPEMTAVDLLRFHLKWYGQAGHKRLGQIYRRIGEAFTE